MVNLVGRDGRPRPRRPGCPPVRILTVTPRRASRCSASRASGFGGSRKTRMPRKVRSCSSAARRTGCAGCGRDPQPHRGLLDPVPEAEQLALDPLVSPAQGSPVPSWSTSTATRASTGRRPPRWGWAHRQRTSRRCRPSNVSGVTSRAIRDALGSSRVRGGEHGPVRPDQLRPGVWRRSTATSCWSTSSSASFDTAECQQR